METPHAILPAEILLSVLGLASPASRLAATSSAVATLLRGRAVQHAWVIRIVFSDTTFCDDNGDNDGQKAPLPRLCTFLEPFENMINDFRLLDCVDNNSLVPSYWAQYRRQHDEKHDERVKQSIAAVYSFAPLLASAAIAAIQNSHSITPMDARAANSNWQGTLDLVRLCVFFLRIRHLEAYSSTLQALSQQPPTRLSIGQCSSCVTFDAQLFQDKNLHRNHEHFALIIVLMKAVYDMPPLDFLHTLHSSSPSDAFNNHVSMAIVYNVYHHPKPCVRTLYQDPERFVQVFQWVHRTLFCRRPFQFFVSTLVRHVDNYRAFLCAFKAIDLPNLGFLDTVHNSDRHIADFSDTFAFYTRHGLGFEMLRACLQAGLLDDCDIGVVVDSVCMMEDDARRRVYRI
ncbi:hypothetical protein BCR44DRAFT_37610 [Catenaria anguillulae PL171]|uniref:F-box domain-containing protein n=1 Tax=Catenaria anguillulae PL171 TaxID=765915 RepID=A0A1Y2HVI8_9FUNG|nr:hypothetical protein BCR44DRAFT_37610 [Catenaria anguillulae PL171]